jgi:hypothetical protein
MARTPNVRQLTDRHELLDEAFRKYREIAEEIEIRRVALGGAKDDNNKWREWCASKGIEPVAFNEVMEELKEAKKDPERFSIKFRAREQYRAFVGIRDYLVPDLLEDHVDEPTRRAIATA